MLSFDYASCFVAKTKTIKSAEDLNTLLINHFKEIGVKMYEYRHFSPVGALDNKTEALKLHYNFPGTWRSDCDDTNRSIHDIVFEPVTRKGAPFKWDELIAQSGQIPKIADYIVQKDQLDIGIGIGLPVYGRCSRSGIFILGFEPYKTKLEWDEISLLQWVCQAAHHKYTDLILESYDTLVKLSKREQEVLKWITLGKSNNDIAAILNISSHTIATYMRSIFLKLNVYDRVSASLRAITLGLV